jgi:Fe-Mn family superoxide dismutase
MTTPVPSAFTTVHESKPLPFDHSALDGLSEKLIRSHWENNYGGSVKALNTIQQRLAGALADPDLPPFVYNDLKREHLMRTGSVVLHELYFDNLGGTGKPDASLRKALVEHLAALKVEKGVPAHGCRPGTGWCVGVQPAFRIFGKLLAVGSSAFASSGFAAACHGHV